MTDRSLWTFCAASRLPCLQPKARPALHPPRDAHPSKAKPDLPESRIPAVAFAVSRAGGRAGPRAPLLWWHAYAPRRRRRRLPPIPITRTASPPLQAHAVSRRARSPPPNHPTRRQFRNEPATTRPHTRLCSFFDARAPCCRRGRSGRCRCRRGGCGCRGWARTGARLRRRGRWRSRGGGRRCSGCCTASPSPSTSSPSPTSSRRPPTPAWLIRCRCRCRRRRRARGRRRASLARWGGRPGCPSPAGRPSSSRRWHRRGAPRGGEGTAGAERAASAAAATACCSTSTCPAPSPAASPRRAPALAPARPPSPPPPPSSSPRTPTRGRETATPSSAG